MRPLRERCARRVLGAEGQSRDRRCLGLGVGVATHSKCFLIFSDSAYLEIPLMKRVRFTWSERQVRGAGGCREGVGGTGEQRGTDGVGGGLRNKPGPREFLVEIRQEAYGKSHLAPCSLRDVVWGRVGY